MDYSIRELRQNESKVLNTFLYEAIFIPEGVPIPPKEIINQPELQVYVKDFGKNKGDLCLVAEANNEIVGAVWCRIMNDYGHIDAETPSFATVYKGNIIKNLIMDCQSYAKYRPNETTGGIFVSWRRKEELPTGA